MTEPRIKIHEAEDLIPSARSKYQFPFLDEFVADGVSIHFEAMGNAQFWIGVRHPDGRLWHINCGAVNPNAKGYAHVEDEGEAGEQP